MGGALFRSLAARQPDAHGLVSMDRQTTNCWSTDRHLTLAGAVLPPKP